jgi:ribosomal protein S12 methylthiotransferase accessory factor
MDMEIRFPGGLAVEALHKGFRIATDQPREAGGEGGAPAPFDLFLASLGTCAGLYALRFCQERQLPTAGLSLTLTTERDREAHRLARVRILIRLPAGFPPRYVAAIERAANLCAVKRAIADPPEFETVAQAAAAQAAPAARGAADREAAGGSPV